MLSNIPRFMIIHKDAVLLWINDPIFPHASATAFKKLGIIVHAPAAWRYDLDDPARGVSRFLAGVDNGTDDLLCAARILRDRIAKDQR